MMDLQNKRNSDEEEDFKSQVTKYWQVDRSIQQAESTRTALRSQS